MAYFISTLVQLFVFAWKSVIVQESTKTLVRLLRKNLPVSSKQLNGDKDYYNFPRGHQTLFCWYGPQLFYAELFGFLKRQLKHVNIP